MDQAKRIIRLAPVTCGVVGVSFLAFLVQPSIERFGLSRAAMDDGRWWCLFTRVFLHESAAHFFANVGFFAVVSFLVESALKPGRNLGLFVTVVLASGCVAVAVQPQMTFLGLSSVAHGYFAALGVVLAKRGEPKLTVLMLAGLLVKFGLDLWAPQISLAQWTLGGGDHGSAFAPHFAGALSGAVATLFFAGSQRSDAQTK